MYTIDWGPEGGCTPWFRDQSKVYTMDQGEGGNQAYSRLSTTHGHITDCKLDSVVYAGQVYACELMWTCLVWAERSTPDSFGVPSHRFNFTPLV